MLDYVKHKVRSNNINKRKTILYEEKQERYKE